VSPKRIALLSAVLLAAVGLFSLVMSLLAEDSRWPQLPPGSLRGVDLVAGFAVAIALIAILARRPRAGSP
jgi:hypothetical protein